MRENKRRAFWQELGERLAVVIKEKGWTKKYFSEMMNIQESAVNKYLSGEFDPTNFIEKLVDSGIDKDWFLTGKKIEKKEGGIYVYANGDQEINESQIGYSVIKSSIAEYENLKEKYELLLRENIRLEKELAELKNKA